MKNLRFSPVRLLAASTIIATSLAMLMQASQTAEGPTYNSQGQLIVYRHSDGTSETYSYDSAGQVKTFTDRAGAVAYSSSSSSSDSTGTAVATANSKHKKHKPTPTPTPSASPLDATLSTTYTLNFGDTNISWVVCGSTQQTFGCYGSGGFGPFGKIGALLEGNPTTDTTAGTVTRDIYILDIASGSTSNGVTLYVYQKTDTISPSYDAVSTSLVTSISLPLTGGSSALASMAGNDAVLVAGTNQSPSAVEIQKGNFNIGQIGGFSPSINVAAITSDQYGYITITFGSFNNFNNGFIVLDPTGQETEFGGGADFMLNTNQAVLPSNLP
jgi:YD repeat-containing protein